MCRPQRGYHLSNQIVFTDQLDFILSHPLQGIYRTQVWRTARQRLELAFPLALPTAPVVIANATTTSVKYRVLNRFQMRLGYIKDELMHDNEPMCMISLPLSIIHSKLTKPNMLILVSPAKTLDFDTAPRTQTHTQPDFLKESRVLMKGLKGLAPQDLSKLMGISDKLAALNVARFQSWKTPFSLKNAKQAALAFKGDVYTGLDAETLTDQHDEYAQQHLRILSGLYGLLRPLDLIQPYRLEMGVGFNNAKGKDLYAFWDEKITQQLNKELEQQQSDVVINLASNEYFKAVKPKQLNARVITPIFKDAKNGQYKIISFYAKKARGLMARYIIEKGLQEPNAIKRFKVAGYRYNKDLSAGDNWVFTREQDS